MTPAQRTSWLVRAICIVATMGSVWAAHSAWMEPIELRARDMELSNSPGAPPDADVVIVALDEKAIHKYGPPVWPPRRMAQLVDAIDKLQPRVIGLDFIFTGEVDRDNQADAPGRLDPLRDAIQRSGKVIGGTFYDTDASDAAVENDVTRLKRERMRQQRVRMVRFLPGASPRIEDADFIQQVPDLHLNADEISDALHAFGHLNLVIDTGSAIHYESTVRYMPLVTRIGGDLYASFDTRVAGAFLGDAPIEVDVARDRVDELRIGDRKVETDEHGRLPVHYTSVANRPAMVSAADVLEGRVPPEALRGKIALVGVTAPATGDAWSTPIRGLMPGIEIHANTVANLLQGTSFIENWKARIIGYALLIILGLIGFAVLPYAGRFGMVKTGAAATAFAGVLILGHYLLLSRGGYAVVLVSPLLLTVTLVGGTMIVDYFSETKQRKQVERSFRHYLDPLVIAELMEHPERLQLGGERRELSVLFCDIRNFTSVSEAVPPERVVKMLNDFFTTMSDIVLSTGGLVDKFVGDQIMAFWGAPVARADHAIQSCRAALRFRDEFQRLRQEWQEAGGSSGATGELSGFMNCGVGINTGAMVVGNIGSSQRFSYTVIGDTVNVAARLEALNKEFGTTILVGPGTRDGAAEVMRFREVDEVRVKGKAKPTAVYELLGEAGAPFDEEWLRAFAEGVAAFRAGNWLVAETAFAEALRRNPKDGCAEYYRRRLERSEARPARAAEGGN